MVSKEKLMELAKGSGADINSFVKPTLIRFSEEELMSFAEKIITESHDKGFIAGQNSEQLSKEEF